MLQHMDDRWIAPCRRPWVARSTERTSHRSRPAPSSAVFSSETPTRFRQRRRWYEPRGQPNPSARFLVQTSYKHHHSSLAMGGLGAEEITPSLCGSQRRSSGARPSSAQAQESQITHYAEPQVRVADITSQIVSPVFLLI